MLRDVCRCLVRSRGFLPLTAATAKPEPVRFSTWYKKLVDSNKPAGQSQPSANLDISPSELKGRDLIKFENWTREDIFTVLWIAMDLKQNTNHQHLCRDKSATLIFEDVVSKTGIAPGIGGVGAVVSSTHSSHLENMDMEYLGSALSSGSEAIFVDSSKLKSEDLLKLALGSSKPVISVRTADMAPLHALAECLALIEHYGYLRRLVIAYLGPIENPMLHTYIHLYPKIGLHFRYFAHEQNVNEDVWCKGIEFSNKSSFRTDLQHYANVEDAIFRAHVMITTLDPSNPIKLTPKDMKEAELDWTFLHHNIHKGTACSKDLLRCKQSLVWKYVENLQWITKALLVATTTGYQPSIRCPGFQGVP